MPGSKLPKIPNERAQRLLKALVDRYIRDGQPVGSKTLSRDSGLDISPATIRNVMTDLEELGFVTAPHTSAGRIPTIKGYRFFVDTLVKLRPPKGEELQLFQQALRGQPDDAPTRTRWGDLYADSHQDGEAMNIYREALSADPSNEFAILGAASLLVGGFDEAADNYLAQLLTGDGIADGARIGAWLLVARLALENGDVDKALAVLDSAEDLVTQYDWPVIEIYALRAAADQLNNVSDSQWVARSLQYNPRYGGIYALPAHFQVITRRYRDAIDLYQKAVDIEPDLASAHEEMGVNLLRDNQFSRARTHLEIAHDIAG